jgi:hypothetical protein
MPSLRAGFPTERSSDCGINLHHVLAGSRVWSAEHKEIHGKVFGLKYSGTYSTQIRFFASLMAIGLLPKAVIIGDLKYSVSSNI